MEAKYSEVRTYGILDEVMKEGDRARKKHGEVGRRGTNLESLSILLEEVGEVATAINQDLPQEELRKELIQVASVAVRWLAGDLIFSHKP